MTLHIFKRKIKVCIVLRNDLEHVSYATKLILSNHEQLSRPCMLFQILKFELVKRKKKYKLIIILSSEQEIFQTIAIFCNLICTRLRSYIWISIYEKAQVIHR